MVDENLFDGFAHGSVNVTNCDDTVNKIKRLKLEVVKNFYHKAHFLHKSKPILKSLTNFHSALGHRFSYNTESHKVTNVAALFGTPQLVLSKQGLYYTCCDVSEITSTLVCLNPHISVNFNTEYCFSYALVQDVVGLVIHMWKVTVCHI